MYDQIFRALLQILCCIRRRNEMCVRKISNLNHLTSRYYMSLGLGYKHVATTLLDYPRDVKCLPMDTLLSSFVNLMSHFLCSGVTTTLLLISLYLLTEYPVLITVVIISYFRLLWATGSSRSLQASVYRLIKLMNSCDFPQRCFLVIFYVIYIYMYIYSLVKASEFFSFRKVINEVDFT